MGCLLSELKSSRNRMGCVVVYAIRKVYFMRGAFGDCESTLVARSSQRLVSGTGYRAQSADCELIKGCARLGTSRSSDEDVIA